MGVIRTDKWLRDLYENPIELCEKLESYFEDAQSFEICSYLSLYGMYHHPARNGNKLLEKLKENKVWEVVQTEERELRNKWRGPAIPIFIFPADTTNQKIQRDLNGKSGIAFKDKLFLFLSANNTEDEIRALFTHEYNHICRLSNYKKDEKDYTLIDAIILEGLAESAVFEHVGDRFTASWTEYYSPKQLKSMWNNLLLPNKDLSKNDRNYRNILYGLHRYPKMAGYCVGYYLAKKYMDEQSLTSSDLLSTETETIAQLNNEG
ncbi:DUF2268 domain-containing protein [Virgibacillus oceani]|uniref:DUF2268 domain-containing protein n=1 Tax=Virgibacillus oceani TaxID=1479511 RepID=A0A917HRM6_9BACI|nr:DUF2268 domain-containing protein [Virgibacillus oceani]GGG87166.1 hypothetical protein GCM10011398_36260 [Virgibacillus oceani]